MSTNEICLFLRKISVILASLASGEAGISDNGIDRHAKHKPGSLAAETLKEIVSEIRSGAALSPTFQKRERLFGIFFCSMIAQAERSGNPRSALHKLSEHYERKNAFNKKLTRLLRFPLIIMLGATGCFLTLLLFFIPLGLKNVWACAGTIPSSTKAVVSIIALLGNHTLEMAVLSGIILILLFRLGKFRMWSPQLSSLAWKIPFIGDIIRKNSLSRFSFSLSALFSSGFDSMHALPISAHELRNNVLEKQILHTATDTISNSNSIFSILKGLSIFPPLLMDFAVDEKKETAIDEYLKKIATFYQDEVEAACNALIILIGPVFISITGFLGLGTVIALYLPVFKVVGNP